VVTNVSSHEIGVQKKNDNLNNLICYDSIEFSSGFGVSSPYKLEMEPPMMQNHNFSSCFSCFSFGFGVSLGLTKGMFQCIWNQSIPHFVFCADKNEIYVAKLNEIEAKDDESLDYVYLIYLTKGSKNGNKIFDSDLQELVGKLNVSTIFTLCSNNYIMMETHFVLFGDIQIHDKEMHTSKKRKGFSKKVGKVLRTLSMDLESHSYDLSEISLLGKNVPTNFEVGAIVVKEHVPFNCLDKIGGWGSKFLNKLPSECYGGKNEDYLNSMSIVIPAGIHGGPTTRDGGPSSLIDRWKSSGCCDCGGWDEGCPLTVFQRRQTDGEVLFQEDVHGDFKTLDIVSQVS